MTMTKVGRNDPCPCGSGTKFKKCCLHNSKKIPVRPMTAEMKLQMDKMNAQQKLRKHQQGLGKEIIATNFKDHQMVAVGSRLYYSKNWATFHDFLRDYLPGILGKEWFEAEIKKPEHEQHPIIRWRKIAFDHMKKSMTDGKVVHSGKMNGAAFGYFHLAYNLYLLAHNAKIQEHLLSRLRNKVGFLGACYETYVASVFVKAGFKLELENEQDGSESHCEFSAEHSESRQYFSVEAKARQPNKDNVGIGNQLYRALAKKAKHARVVFIDVNVPELLSRFGEVIGEIDRKEQGLKIDGIPADPAFVFITNHSYAYDLEGFDFERTGFCHGYKIPEFKTGHAFTSIRDAHRSRSEYKAMHLLIKSMNEHTEIPTTFDGQHPEFVYDKKPDCPRLVIGNSYFVPTKDGDQEGVLTTATVMESERKVMGVYKLPDGSQIMVTSPMTHEEWIAYKRHPDTFFGIEISTTRNARDPMELFDFFYESYRKSPRNKLLEFVAGYSDFENLQKLSDEELLITCCERWAYSAMRTTTVKTASPPLETR